MIFQYMCKINLLKLEIFRWSYLQLRYIVSINFKFFWRGQDSYRWSMHMDVQKNKIWQKCVALRNKTVLIRSHAYWPWTNHASCPRHHSILQVWHHPSTSGVKLCHVCQIHYMWFENTMTFLYLNIISLGFYTKHSFV